MTKVFPGVWRKLSLPVVVLSLLGWILYIIGFALVNNTANYKTGLNMTFTVTNDCTNVSSLSMPPQRASLYWFPHWVMVVIAPFLYFNIIIYLAFPKWFTEIPANIVTVLYLVCGGAVTYTWAVELFDTSALIAVQRVCPPYGWLTDREWGLWPLIEWAGCLISICMLTIYLMMRAFSNVNRLKQGKYEDEEEYDETQNLGEEKQGEDYED